MSDMEKALQAAQNTTFKPTVAARPKVGNVASATSVAASKQASKQAPPVEDAFGYPVAGRMGFIGCGQAGGRIAQAFWSLGYRRIGVLNTTENDFDGLDPELPKLSMDIGGASKNMSLAKKTLAEREVDVRDLFQRAWGPGPMDCVLICAGLGGGTGGGMASSLVSLARRHLATTPTTRIGAIVSLPQPGEGQLTCRNAVTAFAELVAAKISPIIVVDNDRVKSIYEPPMKQLYPRANSVVAELINVFNHYAASKGHISFDRSEFFQLLDSGMIVMGAANIDPASVKTPADIRETIRSELTKSVLTGFDLRRGTKGVCLFVTSPEVQETFSSDYFMEAFEQLNQLLGSGYSERPDTVLHRGVYEGDPDAGIQCYTMIGGLEPPASALEQLARVGGLSASTAPPALAQFLGV